MKNKTLLQLIFVSFLLLSCTNDSTSDLIDNDIEQISYTNSIKSIIDNNCVVCHASTPINGAPMSLTTYDDVKNAILTRDLLDRISRPQGEVGMMPNGGTRLPQSIIDQISTWATQGFNE
jgi:uncharacterized membrane protein